MISITHSKMSSINDTKTRASIPKIIVDAWKLEAVLCLTAFVCLLAII